MNVALVAIAGEFEQPYLLEWAKWHFKLGFDAIHLYLNNWSIDSIAWLKNTDFGGKMVLERIDGECQQLPAYNKFIDSYRRHYQYALFLDCDEFLDLNGAFDNVHSMFRNYSDWPEVGFNWVLFGDSNLKFDGNFNVLSRFTHCQKTLNIHTKCALNLSHLLDVPVKFINPHCTNLDIAVPSKIDATRTHVICGPFNKEICDVLEYRSPFIRHFFCKTKEEYIKRRSFGKADTPSSSPQYKRSIEEFDAHNFNEICIAERYRSTKLKL